MPVSPKIRLTPALPAQAEALKTQLEAQAPAAVVGSGFSHLAHERGVELQVQATLGSRLAELCEQLQVMMPPRSPRAFPTLTPPPPTPSSVR